jgi:hypothetical protein
MNLSSFLAALICVWLELKPTDYGLALQELECSSVDNFISVKTIDR